MSLKPLHEQTYIIQKETVVTKLKRLIEYI